MSVIRASNAWEDKENSIKEQLRAYRNLIRQHQINKEILESYSLRITSRISDSKVLSIQGNIVEDKCIAKMDLENKMCELLEAKLSEFQVIHHLIRDLPIQEYLMIFHRYCLDENMDQISKNLHLSVAGCWRLHKRAISNLVRKVDSN